jgi:alternate signal-mediated exported protein
MNKLAKGAIAAGAATVLLVGGAGTLAFWSDQAPVAGGTLTSGFLSLDVADATWTDITGALSTTFDPTVDKIVPGDVIQYTAHAIVSGEGKNLEASLFADTASISGDLLPYVDVTFTVDGVTSGTLAHDLGAIGAAVTHDVTLVFTFDPDAELQEGMNAELDLDAFDLTLAQNTNP